MTEFIAAPKSRFVSYTIAALLAGSLLAGGVYYISIAHAKPAPAPVAQAAIPVTVQTVKSADLRLWSDFSGRLHAVDYVEIRPEIGGRITEVRFADGQSVEKGDVLFVIDPRPYQAAVAKAEATLNSAKINAAFAKTEMTRAEDLIKSQAIAQRLYDERSSANRLAQAAISVAAADLDKAKLDLEYAYVKAPIAGRVSRAEITLGNLVQPGPTAPLLTSIVSNDGIYADFEVDEQSYMASARAKAQSADKNAEIPVDLTVQGDEQRLYHGAIHAFDNHIDTASGTVRARAKFANDDGSLMPGMFVSIKMANNGIGKSILIPERAISSDQSKRYVFTVNDKNIVEYREVALGKAVNDQRVVLSGLQEGDRIVTDGVQHVRPDALVDPHEAATPPPAQ